jgi:uncharacterized protein YeeX (DUF496 family)
MKVLTKKQKNTLAGDVFKFINLQEKYTEIQRDFEDVSRKLNERLTHILLVISETFGIKAPHLRSYISITCNNDDILDDKEQIGFQSGIKNLEEDYFVLDLIWDTFPMPSFPTWFFWESDKKIAAYCKKFKEENMAKAKIKEDEELSAAEMICNIVHKLSEDEREFLVSAYGFRF